MASIADQLTQLANDRDDLVSNLTTKGISGLTGDETITELVPEVLNIPSGANLSDYFGTTIGAGSSHSSYINANIKKVPDNLTVSGNSLNNAFSYMDSLLEGPTIDTTNITLTNFMFYNCPSLETCPAYNLSSVTNATSMFNGCTNLENVPQFNMPNCNYVTNMFGGCSNLTNESLNNILGTLTSINVGIIGAKTLYNVFSGDMSQYYPASTIQGLSNYQAFTNAGWTIGW